MTNIITGDSHIAALKQATLEFPQFEGKFDFIPLGRGGVAPTKFYEFDELQKEVRIIAQDWRKFVFSTKALEEFGANPRLFVSLPLNTSRILRDYSWQTHVPWNMLENSHELALSDKLIEEIIDQDSWNSVQFVKALASIGINVTVLEAPQFLNRGPNLNSKRLDVLQYIAATYRSRVRDGLRDSEIPIIAQPENTLDENGTTKPIYNNPEPRDHHHANTEYGALMLQTILDMDSAR